jgi:hypothetical protein
MSVARDALLVQIVLLVVLVADFPCHQIPRDRRRGAIGISFLLFLVVECALRRRVAAAGSPKSCWRECDRSSFSLRQWPSSEKMQDT